jgi:hypothetical protein
VPDHIELHDSWVVASMDGGAVVLRLCPAYVHHWERVPGGWRGEGRRQEAEIHLEPGSLAAPPPAGLFQIADGWLEVLGERFDNLLPTPLTARAAVRGRLEFANAPPLVFAGAGVRVRLTGDAEFVEALPTEWAPADDAG